MCDQPTLFDQEAQAETLDENESQEDEAQWRRRALTAESRLEQVQEELDRAAQSHEKAQRRHEIERLLRAQGALDMETALVMTEAALERMETPDAAKAVDELRRTKCFLFAQRARSGAMGEQAQRERDPLESARTDARARGDRKALLRYLRLKRTG